MSRSSSEEKFIEEKCKHREALDIVGPFCLTLSFSSAFLQIILFCRLCGDFNIILLIIWYYETEKNKKYHNGKATMANGYLKFFFHRNKSCCVVVVLLMLFFYNFKSIKINMMVNKLLNTVNVCVSYTYTL